MTIDEAIESMRLAVNELAAVQCQQMRVLADVWREAEATVKCETCGGCGWVDQDDGREIERGRYTMSCPACHGAGVVSNGNAARGDALELLGECGKCGFHPMGYASERGQKKSAFDYGRFAVPGSWWQKSEPFRPSKWETIAERLALMNAYAAADQETRERWAAETRELSEGVT